MWLVSMEMCFSIKYTPDFGNLLCRMYKIFQYNNDFTLITCYNDSMLNILGSMQYIMKIKFYFFNVATRTLKTACVACLIFLLDRLA